MTDYKQPFVVRYKGHLLKTDFAKTLIDALPRKLQIPALRHGAEFMLTKMKPYPAYKWATRRAAYGVQAGGPGFFSAKQRKFVMASLRAGHNLKTGSPMEPGYPHRIGKVQRSWEIQGKGVDIVIVNTSPVAPYLYSPFYQARQPALVGWKPITQMVEDNKDAMVKDLAEFISQKSPEIVDKILLGL